MPLNESLKPLTFKVTFDSSLYPALDMGSLRVSRGTSPGSGPRAQSWVSSLPDTPTFRLWVFITSQWTQRTPFSSPPGHPSTQAVWPKGFRLCHCCGQVDSLGSGTLLEASP